MSDLMREQFEKRYPVPFNTEWSEKMKRYVWNEKDNSLSAAMEHNKIFDAWQASRECLVIELPPSIGVTPIGGDGIQEFIDCNGEYLHGHLVVDAIHAAGVKTK